MTATHALVLVALIAASCAIAAVARRHGRSAPILLVLAGLAASYVPGMPEFALNPDLVLLGILPPLLYTEGLRNSYLSIRDSIRPIGLLSVGLVLFTVACVAVTLLLTVPGVPVAVALTLGAIVAPTDAVTTASVGRRLHLPRRLMTIISGESMLNDGTGLTAYQVAVRAAQGAGLAVLATTGRFLAVSAGGIVIGLALGAGVQALRSRVRDPLAESATAILVPYAAYLIADAVGASGVLAVVVAALYLGHHAGSAHFATRLQDTAVWGVAAFVLESLVFALIGLQLRPVVHELSKHPAHHLAEATAAVLATVIMARIVWVFPTTYLLAPVRHWHPGRPQGRIRLIREARPGQPGPRGPRGLRGRAGQQESAEARRPSWRMVSLLSWAGMRGMISLVAAFALPTGFPQRTLLLFLTFSVVLGTLLLQGLTFPGLIRLLGVTEDRDQQERADMLAEAAAQETASAAGLRRLDELASRPGPDGRLPDERTVERLRRLAERRQFGAWERLDGGTGRDGREVPSAAFRRLRLEMTAAERAAFITMRDQREIDDEILDRVLRELDLEEAMLSRGEWPG
jgi:NhaP-type Na+/H+ or K+/H+ antiporter